MRGAPRLSRSSSASAGVAAVLACAALLGLSACDRPPSDQGLPEWTATDHDRNEEQQRAASGQQAPSSAAQAAHSDGGAAPDPMATLVDVTWRTQCALCHGLTGRGDGPNGPMVRAPNFADPDFQQSHTDEQLAASILNGKGKMPKFDVPPPIAAAFVRRVRLAGGMR